MKNLCLLFAIIFIVACGSNSSSDKNNSSSFRIKKSDFGNGEEKSYFYDEDGKLIKWNWKDSQGNTSVKTLEYNSINQLEVAHWNNSSNSSVILTYSYNDTGLLNTLKRHEYDNDEQIHKYTTSTYYYNLTNQLIQRQWEGSYEPFFTTANYSYNDLGKIIKINWKSDDKSTSTEYLNFDVNQRLIRWDWSHSGGRIEYGIYEYDSIGRRLRHTGFIGSENFVYTYEYDSVGCTYFYIPKTISFNLHQDAQCKL